MAMSAKAANWDAMADRKRRNAKARKSYGKGKAGFRQMVRTVRTPDDIDDSWGDLD